ncbi:hypothetical protein [Arthrobacter sp. AD-310]
MDTTWEMKKVTLADTWALAWTGALAFADESKKPYLKFRAALSYPRHFAYILPAALEGSLWHSNRRVMVGISGTGEPRNGYSQWILAGMLGILMGPLGIDLRFLIAVFVILFVALVRGRPLRRFRAWSAIRAWKKELHPEQVYEIVYLAKHPDEPIGDGFRFAKAAISKLVPPGSPICTIARSENHVDFYRLSKFRQLPYRGKQTAGMAAVAPA